MEALLTIKVNKVESRLTYHKTDILDSNEKHIAIAICAPADFGVKSGLLRKMWTKFGGIKQLRKQHKELGDCTVRVENFYLITKYRNTDITYLGILENCLKKIAQICREKKINRLALPKMQGGLDKFDWSKTVALLNEHIECHSYTGETNLLVNYVIDEKDLSISKRIKRLQHDDVVVRDQIEKVRVKKLKGFVIEDGILLK